MMLFSKPATRTSNRFRGRQPSFIPPSEWAVAKGDASHNQRARRIPSQPQKFAQIRVHVKLTTVVQVVYVLDYFSYPLPLFPCILVEGISNNNTGRPFRSRRIENFYAHRVRDQFVSFAQ